MAKTYPPIRIESTTLNRLKKIKPLIEIDEHIHITSWSNLIDYLISYRTKEPFNLEKFKI